MIITWSVFVFAAVIAVGWAYQRHRADVAEERVAELTASEADARLSSQANAATLVEVMSERDDWRAACVRVEDKATALILEQSTAMAAVSAERDAALARVADMAVQEDLWRMDRDQWAKRAEDAERKLAESLQRDPVTGRITSPRKAA